MKKIGKFLKNPENFFTEFENLISSEEEEWQSIK